MHEAGISNEPPLLRAMRTESEFTESVVKIYGAERGQAEAQRLMARAEAEYRKADRIVDLMMPEVMQMLLREGLQRNAITAGRVGA
jgi:hypothetical protein